MEQRNQIIKEYLGTRVHVVVDRPIGYCHGGLVYPINYGYIPGTLAGDGEEQDAYILGIDVPLVEFDGQVIGAVRRNDDCEDKLVVAPVGTVYHQAQIAEAVHFQEQFFDTRIFSCFEKSCGVLPYREVNGQREFLLVFEAFSQCWSLPKGHMERGETEAEAALRELWEETGLTDQLDTAHSATIEYPVGPLGRKQVVFFPGQVSGTPQVRPGEIKSYKWVTEAKLAGYLFPDTVKACLTLIKTIQ